MKIGINHSGEPETWLESPDEISAFLDQLSQATNTATTTADAGTGVNVRGSAEVNVRGDANGLIAMVFTPDAEDGPVLQIGIHGTTGWATYSGPGSDGVVSRGSHATGIVHYSFQGNPSEWPAWMEIPFATVKAAVLEFFRTDGSQPTAPTWRPASEFDI